MKKVLLIVAIIAVLALACYIGYNFLNDSNDIINPNNSGDVYNPGNQDDTTGLAAQVKVESVKVENRTDHIDINNVYPRITSFKDKEFENSINNQIAQNISGYRQEINGIVDEQTPVTKLYKYVTTFEKNTWGDYLTLIVEQDYQTGGIRSNTWKEIYNINARTERLMYLNDLFEATTNYEKEIINEITKQAAQKNYSLMGGEGLVSLPTKQKFYIRDGKLFIYFDPSEAAAATYGALEFEMPFVLNENGYFEVK